MERNRQIIMNDVKGQKDTDVSTEFAQEVNKQIKWLKRNLLLDAIITFMIAIILHVSTVGLSKEISAKDEPKINGYDINTVDSMPHESINLIDGLAYDISAYNGLTFKVQGRAVSVTFTDPDTDTATVYHLLDISNPTNSATVEYRLESGEYPEDDFIIEVTGRLQMYTEEEDGEEYEYYEILCDSIKVIEEPHEDEDEDADEVITGTISSTE